MNFHIRIAALAALCLVGVCDPALAQQTDKTATDAAKKKDTVKPPAAADVSSDPQNTTASFGDWIERCQRVTGESGAFRVCEAAHSVQVQGQNGPIAQIAVGRLKKGDPLRVTLVLPVNIAFPSSPRLSIEGKTGSSLDLGWRRCVPGGCIADAALSDDTMAIWRPETGQGRIDWKNSAGQELKIPFSFKGFAQALDALGKETP